MTSLGDNLDPNGKVIRILSLGEDGQFLPIGDSQQMQILNQDTLSMMSLTSSENQNLQLVPIYALLLLCVKSITSS